MPSFNIYNSQPQKVKSNLVDLIGDIEPIYNKLALRKKIPGTAIVERPTICDCEFILNQIVKEFFASYEKTKRRLQGKSEDINFCWETSTILRVNNTPIGIFITHPLSNELEIYVYGVIVTKKWRKTWATTFLKYHSFKRLQSVGLKTIVYQIYQGNNDTIKHANRVHSVFYQS